MISFSEALQLTLNQIHPLSSEYIDLTTASGRVVTENLISTVDSPSVDVSLKDGYAIKSSDIAKASAQNQITLQLIGAVTAGDHWEGEVQNGEAVRILSGAPIPRGAEAVIAEEFTRVDGSIVTVMNDAGPGRNVLYTGNDLENGEQLVSMGSTLFPPTIGFLAAAGYSQIPVIRRPRVAIVATGDEVIAPGTPMVKGKLYASNLVTLAAWCFQFGFEINTFVVKDEKNLLRRMIEDCLEEYDVLLTSGGAWSGERDLVVRILAELGWEKIYHRVRMGPGKAVGFGLYENKPIFCLPGGPPSNHMAFLQLALPGLQKMAGNPEPGLPRIDVRLSETVKGQSDWTQFVHGKLKEESNEILFYPLKQKSRLQMIAQTEGILTIPEGQDLISKGDIVQAQKLI